jgi:hypothetical protein
MRINNLVISIIITVLAALLLVDGILGSVNPTNQLLSLADVKGIVGVVLLVLAASYLKAANQ